MAFSLQRILSYCRLRGNASSSSSEDPTATISSTSATASEPESEGSDTRRKSQPEPSISKLSKEPSTKDYDSLDEQANFTWQDIHPPEGFSRRVNSPCRGSHSTPQHPHWTGMIRGDRRISMENASLPSYNDISGPVVTDRNGLPRFLSPQREEERKARLEQAVRERMLGFERRTEFNWARPYHGTALPEYSPANDK